MHHKSVTSGAIYNSMSFDQIASISEALQMKKFPTLYLDSKFTFKNSYTQYPIIRNSDLRWALEEFLKNSQFPDAECFLILQGWALAVS